MDRRTSDRNCNAGGSGGIFQARDSGARSRRAAAEGGGMLTGHGGALLLATMACGLVLAAAGLALDGPAKPAEQEDTERIADLVLANHILADQGVVDGFGHVSVRSAKNPQHYF